MTLAAAISRFSSSTQDIHIDIYESADKFAQIGAGVGMLRRTWSVLKALGFQEGLEEVLGRKVDESQPSEYIISDRPCILLNER